MLFPLRSCRRHRALWVQWDRLCALSLWMALLQGESVGLLFFTAWAKALQAGSPTHFDRCPAGSGVLVVLHTPPEPCQSWALVILCWAAAEGVISSAELDPNCQGVNRVLGVNPLRNQQGERGSSAFQTLNHQSGGRAFCYHPSKLLRALEGLCWVMSHIYSVLLCDKPQDLVGNLGKVSPAVLEVCWTLSLLALQA